MHDTNNSLLAQNSAAACSTSDSGPDLSLRHLHEPCLEWPRNLPRRQHGTARGKATPKKPSHSCKERILPNLQIWRSGHRAKEEQCSSFPANRRGNQPGPWPPSHEILVAMIWLASYNASTPMKPDRRGCIEPRVTTPSALAECRPSPNGHMARRGVPLGEKRAASTHPGLLTGVTYDTEICKSLVVRFGISCSISFIIAREGRT